VYTAWCNKVEMQPVASAGRGFAVVTSSTSAEGSVETGEGEGYTYVAAGSPPIMLVMPSASMGATPFGGTVFTVTETVGNVVSMGTAMLVTDGLGISKVTSE